MKKKTFTRKELTDQVARAAACSSVTIPGDAIRELIRLAIIGFDVEQSQDED